MKTELKNKSEEKYFQKQSSTSLQCGVCAINNLLGQKQFTKQDFENICYNLSDEFLNPYKHFLGGDYDVSILIMALKKIDLQVQWHDARKQFNISNQIDKSQQKVLKGLLLNIKLPDKFYHRLLRFSGRHWISVKIKQQKDQNKFIWLDSLGQESKNMSKQKLQQVIEKQRKIGTQILKVYMIERQNNKLGNPKIFDNNYVNKAQLEQDFIQGVQIKRNRSPKPLKAQNYNEYPRKNFQSPPHPKKIEKKDVDQQIFELQ